MKMINVIKKGTVLALATLGLCLSVSASAGPQWTRVSGIFTSTGIETHNGDSFCENINWVSHTQYIGPWNWAGETSIACKTSYNYGKEEIWFTKTTYCKEGGQIDQERFGCYEFREVTEPEPRCPPAGTITGSIDGKDFGVDSSGRFCANGCVIDVPTIPKCEVTDEGNIEIFSEIGSASHMTYTGEECE